MHRSRGLCQYRFLRSSWTLGSTRIGWFDRSSGGATRSSGGDDSAGWHVGADFDVRKRWPDDVGGSLPPGWPPPEQVGLSARTIGAGALHFIFWLASGLPAWGVELQEGDDHGDHPFRPAWTPRRDLTAQG
jgi:hypothetical protein